MITLKFLLKCYLHHRNVIFSDKKFRKILPNQFVIESFLPPVLCTYYDKYFYAVASKKITFIRKKKVIECTLGRTHLPRSHAIKLDTPGTSKSH